LQWVDHTRQVTIELERVRAGLLNAENAERGFLMTGNENFLESFEPNLDRTSRSLQSLRDLTFDSPMMQEDLNRLEEMVAERTAAMQRHVEARRESVIDPADSYTAMEEAKRMMDGIRGKIREMEAEEDSLLKERSEEARVASRTTLIVVAVGTGFA